MPKIVNYNGQPYTLIGQLNINKSVFIMAINDRNLISIDASKLSSMYNLADMSDIKYAHYIQQVLEQEISGMQNVNYQEIYQRILNINNDITNRVINEEILQKYFNSMIEYPAYDEQAVSAILVNKPNSNFNIDAFINQYLYDFTQDQIQMLLTNFNLNETQRNLLTQRIVPETSSNTNAKTNPGKRKNLALPGFSENKESAFVDTLLLSFTVGTLCGIYLMYFILTIMS